MILIIDMNYRKNSLALNEFVLPIASVASKSDEFDIAHFSELESEIKVKRYDAVIMSGTTLKNMEFTHHVESFGWLNTFEKPVLGICAGMQMIGLVFNSSLKACQEIGMREISTLKENPLFSGRFEAFELHSYTVEPSNEFEIIAVSKNCAQSIKHKQKAIYGVLFHPEVRNEKIIADFLKMASDLNRSVRN